MIEKIGKPPKNTPYDERLTVVEGKIDEIVEFINTLEASVKLAEDVAEILNEEPNGD